MATADEWDSVSAMSILVPLRLDHRKMTAPIMPRSAALSRDWEYHEFLGFGSSKVMRPTTSSRSGSSASSTMSRKTDLSQRPGILPQFPPLPPKGGFELSAPNKAARVRTWVNQSTEAETNNAPVDLMDIPILEPSLPEKPAEEQKVVPGLLKRRPVLKSHQTMAQKAASGTPRAMKQVTLEDCWLNAFSSFKLGGKNTQSDPEKPSTSQDEEPPAATAATVAQNVEKANTSQANEPPVATIATVTQKNVKVPKPPGKTIRHTDSHEVEEIYDAMYPALEAAKCFPGKLELEAQIDLIAVAPMSDFRQVNNEVSLDEWKEIFQPQNTHTMASFWVWQKLTASGADVDSLVDLKWAKKGATRMFEEQVVDRGVFYEYRCKMKNGFTFVIILDEHGKASFEESESALGSSTIHFPHRIWDMTLVLKGAMNLYHNRQDPNLQAAIDDFVKNIWLQPGDALTVFCTEPASGLFSVDKILMKRWTRHKHLSVDQEASSLMLKVTEVQEFAVGRNPAHPAVVRGRIPLLDREKWASSKRLWFEISIVSDEIQKVLAANKDLELGQKSREWSPEDLLGEEIDLKNIPVESNPVAMAIGSSGLGNIFRLGKAVLDRMKFGDQ
jgi:hypothetical protein